MVASKVAPKGQRAVVAQPKADVAVLGGGLLYRVAIRVISSEQGWSFQQLATGVDQFSKGGVVIQASYSPKSNLVGAQQVKGDSISSILGGSKGKLENLKLWLEGQPAVKVPARWVAGSAERAKATSSPLAEVKVIEPKADQAS